MRWPFTLVVVCTLGYAIGQPSPSSAQGRIEIIEPWSVSRLLERHSEFIQEIKTVEGFRVQITATTELADATDMKVRFSKRFPAYKTYLDFHSPYYKLRIGDFRTKLEAYRCLMAIRSAYPDAHIVKDMVNASEI